MPRGARSAWLPFTSTRAQGSTAASRRRSSRSTSASGARARPRYPVGGAPVAQWKSGGLLSRWSEVRILPGAPCSAGRTVLGRIDTAVAALRAASFGGTYHVQLVATNSAGTTYGNDVVFTVT